MKETVLVWGVIAFCAAISITEIYKDTRPEALRICVDDAKTSQERIECTKAIFGSEEQK